MLPLVRSQSPARDLIFSHSGLVCTLENLIFIPCSGSFGFSACAQHVPATTSTVAIVSRLFSIFIALLTSHLFQRSPGIVQQRRCLSHLVSDRPVLTPSSSDRYNQMFAYAL